MVDWSNVRILYNMGHVEVYTMTGKFLFSEDTEDDAIREIGRCYIESLKS